MMITILVCLLLSFLPLNGVARNMAVYYQENAISSIIADISTGQNTQPRLYNGKELDRTNNLFWYDFLARPYDPTRCLFTGPDQKAEDYYPWNQYAFCGNNPINRIDSDGMSWEAFDKNGYFIKLSK